MRMKLARQLDEIFRLERAASLVGGMIAPNTQRHSIARVGQTQLAIRLLFASQLRRRSFHLNMHARGHRVALRGPADFAERHQVHVDLIATAPRIIKARELFRCFNHTARDSRAGITGRIGFQIIFLFMNDDRFSDDRFRAAEFELSLPIKMPFAGSVDGDVAEVAGVSLN